MDEIEFIEDDTIERADAVLEDPDEFDLDEPAVDLDDPAVLEDDFDDVVAGNVHRPGRADGIARHHIEPIQLSTYQHFRICRSNKLSPRPRRPR